MHAWLNPIISNLNIVIQIQYIIKEYHVKDVPVRESENNCNI